MIVDLKNIKILMTPLWVYLVSILHFTKHKWFLHVTIFTQLILFLHLITFLLPNDFKSVINFTTGLFVLIMISSMEFIAFQLLKNSCKLWNPSLLNMLCVHFPNYTFLRNIQWFTMICMILSICVFCSTYMYSYTAVIFYLHKNTVIQCGYV